MYNKLFTSKFSIAIIMLLGSIIDMIIVGRFFGANAMAAIGIASPLIALLCLVANIINTGCETVCSQEIGKGNIEKANSQLGISAICGVSVLIIAVAIVGIFSKDISALLGAAENEEILQGVQDFLLAANLSTPTCVLNSSLIYLLQLNNKGWAAPFAIVLFVATNLSLDLANVFVFKMGLFGMGLATSCAYVVYLATLYIIYKTTKTIVKFSFKNLNIKDMALIIKYGGNRLITSGSVNVLNLLINYITMKEIGATAVAAFSVMNSLMAMFLSVSNALSYSTNMIASIMYGERNLRELNKVIKNFVWKSVGYNVLLTIFILIFANFIVGFYFDNYDETYFLAVRMVKIVSLSLVTYSIGACFIFFFLATKKRLLTYIFTFLQNFAISIICVLLLAKPLGGICIPISYNIAFFIVVLLIMITCSLKSKASPFKTSTYLLVPENFSVDQSQIFNFKVKTSEDLTNMHKAVNIFCAEHQASENTAKCINFITTEIANHAKKFAIDELLNIKYIYLQIICNNNQWIISIRDDYREFNPKQYIAQPYHESEEFEESLKLAKATISTYDYKHLMGFNISTLTINEKI